MEVQITDFENAAYTVFVALLSRAIMFLDLNLYIPISKVCRLLFEMVFVATQKPCVCVCWCTERREHGTSPLSRLCEYTEVPFPNAYE